MNQFTSSLQTSKCISLYDQRGINFVGLFGSYARSEEREDSDIDLLVDFDKSRSLSLFDLVNIQHDFEDILGKKVDLVLKDSVKKIIAPNIRHDLITIYEKN